MSRISVPNKTGQVYIIPYRIQKDEKSENTRFDHTVSFRTQCHWEGE
jgi:hypothetical protein